MALPFIDNETSLTREAVLRSELKALTEESIAMNLYRDYFDGKQELVYSTVLFSEVFGTAFKGFKDNWMKVIINACNNRLKLLNFHFDDDDDDDIAKQIWKVLHRNDIAIQQKDLHEGIMVEGRAFVIVWPDPTIGALVDWQPGQLCRVFYDPDRRSEPLWAVKRWTTETGEIYVTFYTPEYVYKFYDRGVGKGQKKPSSSSALTEIPDVGWFGNLEQRDVQGEVWPLPNPFNRVPVVEFPNTSYKSEIEDAIPQQDALNKTLLDMLVTGEFQAFRQRAIETLSSAPVDGWQAGAGEVWQFRPSFDADGKHLPVQFHEFAVADPSTYMAPIRMWLEHMALTSSTPSRYFLSVDAGGRGDAPSGESLLVDDKPLNDKVEDKQDRWDSKWMEVARLIAVALKINSADSLTGHSVWQDPRHDYRLSKLQEGQAMIEIGIPVEFVIRQLGFTPEEEVTVLAMIEEQKAEQEKREREALAVAKTSGTVSANQPSTDIPSTTVS